jgi:hypothetical protein
MNRLTWIGIIVWGAFVTGVGLTGVGSGPIGDGVQPQDVLFLLSGGIITCLIGVVGLLGFIGWIPGLRIEQKSYS